MILGMSVATFVIVHVIISLIAIVAGLIVMFGMLGSNRMPGLTAIFLLFTILTSATGFVIPPLLTEKMLPSHIVGILSLMDDGALVPVLPRLALRSRRRCRRIAVSRCWWKR